MSLKAVYASVKKFSDPVRAESCKKYFKTGKGDYGEGDIFLGITNPQARQIAKQNKNLLLQQAVELVQSKYHEQRMIGLLIMIEKFKSKPLRKSIFQLYLANTRYINNWDLVDLSAPNIVGCYLLEEQPNKPHDILYTLSASESLWEKRIAIISTLTFIRANSFQHCLNISKALLSDKHDLIHKAVGWMLREVGKRDQTLMEKFIKDNYDLMPRTMLRYAIEKMQEPKRQMFLKKEF